MIKDLHKKIINGETTSMKLTEEYFEAIKKNDSQIGAYLSLTKELAFIQAETIDKKIKNGEKVNLLAGIPGAIKDNICVFGARSTAGSKILDNYIAPYDATVVKKMKKTGAVILGKTNMDEFAMGSSTENSAYQKTKNPLDIERVPGGSSGGSAAAVAGDMAAWALGTDTGGSIRQPASFCGVVGIKPTYGRVSRYGAMAMASSLDQIGSFGKSVEDVAIVLSEIAGEDKFDATSARSSGKRYEDYLFDNPKGKIIGIPKEYFGKGLDERILEKINQAIEKFKSFGMDIKEINLSMSEYALATYYIIMTAEVSSNLARFDGIKYGLSINDQADTKFKINSENRTLLETYLDSRKYGLGSEVKRRIILGTYALSAGYYDAYYRKAQQVRALIKKDFEMAFKKVDFIFSPTAPELPFKLGEKTSDPLKMYLSDIYTVPVNLAGIPALSFSVGTVNVDGKNLSVGGQLMGKWFDEEGILNIANLFEESNLS